MTCYHPLKRFSIGINPETGASLGKVVPYGVDWLETDSNGRYHYRSGDISDSCVEVLDKTTGALDWRSRSPYVTHVYTDYVQIPCGQCIGCRLDYSKQWTERLMLELPYHLEAWFLTLTYNDDMLPTSFVSDEEGSHIAHSLVKKDIQDFMKRIRDKFPPHCLTYYFVGEYGSMSMRPHYHAIIFLDVPLQSLKVDGKPNTNQLIGVSDGHQYFINPLIQKLWYRSGYRGSSAGFHYLSSVTWETCAYVTNYVTKKLNGERRQVFEDYGLVPEFSLISTKPAIGRRYYDEHGEECYEGLHMMLSLGDGCKKFRPPKYFDSLYDIEHHEELFKYKFDRQLMAERSVNAKLANTELDYLALLASEEENFKARASLAMKNKNAGKRI